jgi:hypothetical protein
VIDGRLVTFIANPGGEPIELRLRPSDAATRLVAWDPVEVRSVPLEPDPPAEGRTTLRLSLPAFGSAFVLPSAEPEPAASVETPVPVPMDGAWTLSLPGRPPRAMPDGPGLWTDLDAARGFSGTGTYRLEFDLTTGPADGERLDLDLGVVRDLAHVVVNGRDCGVAWTAPFRVDVTAAVAAGPNVLEVEVVTPWRIRHIAEAGAPTGEVFEPMTRVFEASAEPLDAGLAGPVLLRRVSTPR